MDDAPIGDFRDILETDLSYCWNPRWMAFIHWVSRMENAFRRFRLKLRRRSVCQKP